MVASYYGAAHRLAQIIEPQVEHDHGRILSRKMGIVEEEADESIFWFEMLADAGIVEPAKVQKFIQDANEIIAMTVSSIKTARRGR